MRLMTCIGRILGVLLLCFISVASFAGRDPLVGRWITWDKKTRKPASIIKIWQSKGKFYGKVDKIYRVNGAKPSDRCKACKDLRRGRPILGMVVLRDAKLKGNKYVNGFVLDPRNGKDYHCVLSLSPNGKILKLRGYVGIPLFGRTTQWSRAKSQTG